MTGTKTGTLTVPGASLYYEVSGSGPLLFIAQGGDGNAGQTADLVDRLAADYTVVTYDRRGLARSTPDAPAAPVPITTHADDLCHLLAGLADRPVLVLGSSFGALVGLTMTAAHPELVRTMVAHDPPLIRLLPPGRTRPRRARAGRTGADVPQRGRPARAAATQ